MYSRSIAVLRAKIHAVLPTVPVHDLKIPPRDLERMQERTVQHLILDLLPAEQIGRSVVEKLPISQPPRFSYASNRLGESAPSYSNIRTLRAEITYRLPRKAHRPRKDRIPHVSGDLSADRDGRTSLIERLGLPRQGCEWLTATPAGRATESLPREDQQVSISRDQ